MLQLVHNEHHDWLRRYLDQNCTRLKSPEGRDLGHVYVLEFQGTASYLKVGCTADPLSRLTSLRTEGRRIGCTLTRAWLSPEHPGYTAVEDRVLAACRALSPPQTPRSEYFPHLRFDDARRLALEEVERAQAAENSRRHARLARAATDGLLSAAGSFEPIPDAVRRRFPQPPMVLVRPGAEATFYETLTDRFRHILTPQASPPPLLRTVQIPPGLEGSYTRADRDVFAHYLRHTSGNRPLRQTFKEIARHLHTSPQAVSKAVSTLRHSGLLLEAGRASHTKLYRLNPQTVSAPHKQA